MLRKWVVLLIIAIMVATFGSQAFAVETEERPANLIDLITGADCELTDQFMVTITKPDGDETTDYYSYVICGTTELNYVRYAVSVYDSVKGTYRIVSSYGDEDRDRDVLLSLKDTKVIETPYKLLFYESAKEPPVDSIYATRINSFGLFTKAIELKEGPNKVRICAYTESALTNPLPGKNIQVSDFTINYLGDNIKDLLLRSIRSITDFFKNLF